jgi:VanZ family protein
MKKKIITQIVLISLWVLTVFLIVFASISNGESSTSQSGFFSSFIINFISLIRGSPLLNYEIDAIHFEMRKFIGHFSLFLCNGLLSLIIINCYIKKPYKFLLLIIFGILLASISELLQYFAGGRSATLHDIVLDFSGYIFAILIYYFLIFKAQKAL